MVRSLDICAGTTRQPELHGQLLEDKTAVARDIVTGDIGSAAERGKAC